MQRVNGRLLARPSSATLMRMQDANFESTSNCNQFRQPLPARAQKLPGKLQKQAKIHAPTASTVREAGIDQGPASLAARHARQSALGKLSNTPEARGKARTRRDRPSSRGQISKTPAEARAASEGECTTSHAGRGPSTTRQIAPPSLRKAMLLNRNQARSGTPAGRQPRSRGRREERSAGSLLASRAAEGQLSQATVAIVPVRGTTQGGNAVVAVTVAAEPIRLRANHQRPGRRRAREGVFGRCLRVGSRRRAGRLQLLDLFAGNLPARLRLEACPRAPAYTSSSRQPATRPDPQQCRDVGLTTDHCRPGRDRLGEGERRPRSR